MKIKKTVPYNIKNKFKGWVYTLLIAGMPLVTSCEKDTEPLPQQQTEPKQPEQFDVTLTFNPYNFETVLNPSKLSGYIDNERVKNVYFSVDGSWKAYRAQAISSINKNYFKPVFNMSPKFKGKGHFNFISGEPTKVASDSLDFVKYGYTLGGEQR